MLYQYMMGQVVGLRFISGQILVVTKQRRD